MNSIKEEVTQADWEVALACLMNREDFSMKFRREMLEGKRDVSGTIQAFARHRTEATRPLTAEIADLRAQLDEAMEALDRTWQVINAAGVMNLMNGVQLGPVSWAIKANDAKEYSETILAKRKQP